MSTLLQQNEINEINEKHKAEFEDAYQHMVALINVVIGKTSRARFAVDSVRGTDQALQEVVDALKLAEQAIREGEVGLARMIMSQTKVYDTIKAGFALAQDAEKEDWTHYWNSKEEFINKQVLERAKNATINLEVERRKTNELRRRITRIIEYPIRVLEVNELMDTTKRETENFDKLYADYINACRILGKIPKPIPEDYICPLSNEIMINPVSAEPIRTYEEAYIKKWLLTNNSDPFTRRFIEASMFVPNTVIKNDIAHFYDDLITDIGDSILASGKKLPRLFRKVKSKQTKRRKVKQTKSKRYKRRR